jgi:hypothetical protein
MSLTYVSALNLSHAHCAREGPAVWYARQKKMIEIVYTGYYFVVIIVMAHLKLANLDRQPS